MAPGTNLSEAVDSVRTYSGQFINKRNKKIHCYYWKPEVKPRALVLISHGFTEHSGIYDGLAKEITRKGIFAFAHDHVGHGSSEGSRGYWERFAHLVEDSAQHIKSVRAEYPDVPLFVLGHSMGGTIALMLSLMDNMEVKGLVLIAPALVASPKAASFIRLAMAKVFSMLLPEFPMGPMDFSLSCQDEEKVKAMYEDPLRVKGYYKARPVTTLIQAGQELCGNLSAITVPFCVLQGEKDKICHMSGGKKLHEEAKSSDKTIKIYPNGNHCLHCEPNGISEDVFERVIQWLTQRI